MRSTATRPQSFADRLPSVVPEQEPDISSLPDAMADILYPGRRPRPFRIGVAFESFAGPNYERALGLAKKSQHFRETGAGDTLVHHADFDTAGAGAMRELFQIVGGHAGTELRVDGNRLPYASELWLPLFWLFVTDEP